MFTRNMQTALFVGFGASFSLSANAIEESSSGGQSNVVGGSQAGEGDWNDTAAIYFGWSVGCTGVLVAPDVVLTAGHCIGGITDVHLGTNDYTRGGEVIEVDREVEYTNSWSTYDIGVLILSEESSYEPRMIAQGCVVEDIRDDAEVQIVGYGATDIWGNEYGSKLMEAQTTINDHDCSELQTGCNSSVSPGGEISAGGGGVDACYGDSGGPLYLLTDHGDYVVGLTSRSYSNVYAPCEEGGIYVRPDAVVSWIEQVSGRTLDKPDCGESNQGDDDGGSNGGGSDDNGSSQGDDDGSNDDNGSSQGSDVNQAPNPEAASILVLQGGIGSTTIQANDPDASDLHMFTLIEEPALGQIEMGINGKIRYIADEDVEGSDYFEVAVTDNGTPAESAVVEVEVEVIARGGAVAQGCATVDRRSGGLFLALLGLVLGVGRRKRS